VAVEAVSRVYETAPREVEDQPSFLNAACRIATDLDPPSLLSVLKEIERDLGRVAGPRFGPRAIDLDILMWEGGRWRDERLEVPHPRLTGRRFALVPLLDLDPPNADDLAVEAASLDEEEQAVVATTERLG
jgi:2-amino-4-hydroxy-6-hydroxymethyldihydropteridine diphosphokinase